MPQTDKHLAQSPFTGKFFYLTTCCIAFYQSNLFTRVVDPHHFDADPDSTYHPDADPDSDFILSGC